PAPTAPWTSRGSCSLGRASSASAYRSTAVTMAGAPYSTAYAPEITTLPGACARIRPTQARWGPPGGHPVQVNTEARPARPELRANALLVAAHPLESEEHTSELQSRENLVCRLLLEKKK